ncbi:unnamed protein product [Closterium sp. NIES-64]|nr:unnamed protein product [Closterium sp. NIES-64]
MVLQPRPLCMASVRPPTFLQWSEAIVYSICAPTYFPAAKKVIGGPWASRSENEWGVVLEVQQVWVPALHGCLGEEDVGGSHKGKTAITRRVANGNDVFPMKTVPPVNALREPSGSRVLVSSHALAMHCD